MEKTKKLITTSLFAALICAATFAIRIPTPTFGYIHPGDALVLLSGVLLGPAYGAFAAGLGSALSDLFAGYLVYVPATAIIKALCASTVAVLTKAFLRLFSHTEKEASAAANVHTRIASILIAGIIAETIMVAGYFVFEIFILGFAGDSGDLSSSIQAGIVASAAGVPFNAVQGIFGVTIACILYPILDRITKKS